MLALRISSLHFGGIKIREETMSNRSASTISAYFFSLLKEYRFIIEQMKKVYALYLVGKSFDENKAEVVFHVKIFGKNMPAVLMTASELMKDDKILSNFSPLDVKEIIKAAMGDISEIDAVTFKKQGVSFELINKLTGKRKALLAQELFHDEKVLMTLSKQDLCKVSYQAALEIK